MKENSGMVVEYLGMFNGKIAVGAFSDGYRKFIERAQCGSVYDTQRYLDLSGLDIFDIF
mgnify:CR=1 FL=1